MICLGGKAVCTNRRADERKQCLCEGEASLVVHFKDFLDGVDVGRRPQVQPQVVLVGCAHYLLEKN